MRPKREGNKGRLRFIYFYSPFNEPLREDVDVCLYLETCSGMICGRREDRGIVCIGSEDCVFRCGQI